MYNNLDFFNSFSSILQVLIMLCGAGLFGYFLAWLWYRKKMQGMNNKFTNFSTRLDNLNLRMIESKSKYDKEMTKFIDFTENSDFKENINSLDSQLKSHQKKIDSLSQSEGSEKQFALSKQEFAKFSNEFNSLASRVKSIETNYSHHIDNHVDDSIQKDFSELDFFVRNNMNDSINSFQNRIDKNHNVLSKMESRFVDNTVFNREINELKSLTSSKKFADLADFRSRIDEVSATNEILKQRGDELKKGVIRANNHNELQDSKINQLYKNFKDVKTNSAQKPKLVVTKPKAKPHFKFDSKGMPKGKITHMLSIAELDSKKLSKDDLKLISGIGPFCEKKLNKLGILSFEQVSMLNAADVKLVTDAIKFFPGRIKRDKWVAQARKFHRKNLKKAA